MNSLRAGLLGVAVIALLAGCQNSKQAAIAANQALRSTDNAFSSAAAQQGFAAAFRNYALDDAVLLPDNRAALAGRSAIEQSLQALPAGSSLSWTPQGAEASDELGYSWGIYTFTSSNAAGQPTVAYGKYLSVWKKQSGDWKLAAMMLNESPGPAG